MIVVTTVVIIYLDIELTSLKRQRDFHHGVYLFHHRISGSAVMPVLNPQIRAAAFDLTEGSIRWEHVLLDFDLAIGGDANPEAYRI
jgi:hypothetical protein